MNIFKKTLTNMTLLVTRFVACMAYDRKITKFELQGKLVKYIKFSLMIFATRSEF